MTDLVDHDDIVRIVGAERHDTVHIARAVSAEQTVYILHAKDCLQLHLDGQRDLRACPYSIALDNGIDADDWHGREDIAIAVAVQVDDDGVTTLLPVPVVDLGDEHERFVAMHVDLLKRGWKDKPQHNELHVGARVRHIGDRWPDAYDEGTGVVVAVMEKNPSGWAQSYRQPDIELIVLNDQSRTGGGRLMGVANYHVRVVR